MALPTPSEVGAWFLENHSQPFPAAQGCDGFTMLQDGGRDTGRLYTYAYAWVEAFVDHDMTCFFLLEARVHDGDEETRTQLFLATGYDGQRVVDRGVPIPFGAATREHRDWGLAGLHWFSDLVYAFHEEHQPLGEARPGR
jgi:hypothetical protein